MPKEITMDEVEGLLPRTLAVYQKRSGDKVKFKFRTKGKLYTLKVDTDKTAEVTSKINAAGKSLSIDELD